MLRYIVVDDDDLDRLAVETRAAGYPYLNKIASCSHALEAYELARVTNPDILFADIEMPDVTGLELVKKLSNIIPATIFITSHPEFAIDGFDLNVFDYLVKPLNTERFAVCMARVKDFFDLRSKAFAHEYDEKGYIVIKQGYEKYRLPVIDILYLESMRDYTRIVTPGNQYLVLDTMTGLLSRLPEEKFRRVHRSYAVNIDKVTARQSSSISIDTHQLPIGQSYKVALRDIL